MYLEYLRHIRRDADKHGWYAPPRRGPAQANLHSVLESLSDICENSHDRKVLLLRSYTLFRDLKSNKWNDPKANAALWSFFHPTRGLPAPADVESSDDDSDEAADDAKVSSTSGKTTSCRHCGSSTLHQKVRPKIKRGRNHCPWKDETQKVARKARALLNSHAAANEIDTFNTEIIKEFTEKAKAALN